LGARHSWLRFQIDDLRLTIEKRDDHPTVNSQSEICNLETPRKRGLMLARHPPLKRDDVGSIPTASTGRSFEFQVSSSKLKKSELNLELETWNY
jgi:hypothetical protein